MLVEGIVEKINNWSSGKGYFLRLEKDADDYYSFGSAKMKVGQHVQLDCQVGTGNFKDRALIKDWKENAPILKKAVVPEAYRKVCDIPEAKQEITNMIYREYQIEVMNNCIKDAVVSAQGTYNDIIPIACAFFDKRCKPYHYFELAGKNEFIGGGKNGK